MQKILLIAPAWIGDLVMAHSLIHHLKNHHREYVIDVIAPTWTAPLVARMPEINEILELPIAHGKLALAMRWHLGYTLRNRNYQQAIVLPNSFKSAIVPFAARIERRTGYLGEMRWGLLNDIRKVTHRRMIDRFFALGLTPDEFLPDRFPLPQLTANLDNAHNLLIKLGINVTSQPILAMCPGAEYGIAKRWPVSHFAELARIVTGQGWQVWLFGSQRDAIITNEIHNMSGNRAVDFAGKITLAEVVDILALTNVVVTNDSGLMHIAAALSRPLIALFGSSDPLHTPPLSSNATILYRKLLCSPCFKRTCPRQHLNCLNGITTLDVLTVINKYSIATAID